MSGQGPARARQSGVLPWVLSLAIVGILTGFALLLLSGHYANDGPVILEVTAEHGLHRGDLVVLTGWAAGVLSALALAAGRR
jgi:hypothetical protein